MFARLITHASDLRWIGALIAMGAFTSCSPTIFGLNVDPSGAVVLTGDSDSNATSVSAETNHAPEATTQAILVDQNGSKSITLTGSDSDGDTLTYTLVTQPSHGTITGTPPQVTYIPDSNFLGTDSFTFSVSDGALSSSTVTVNISVQDVCFSGTKPYLVSKSTESVQGNGLNRLDTGIVNSWEGNGALSRTGRYMVFYSESTNLVSGDTNSKNDVFLHDRQLGTTERISISTGGAEGNGDSYGGTVSNDGRYVAYYSSATNLVSDDNNGKIDVFIRDRTLGTTTRLSKSAAGVEGNSDSYYPHVSGNGAYVIFFSSSTNLVPSDTNGLDDVFLWDLANSTIEIVSLADDESQGNLGSVYNYGISEDGRYVVFSSYSTNLVANDTNNQADIFVRDRTLGTTTRVSVATDGTEGNAGSTVPTISANGRYITFTSNASNLVAADTNIFRDTYLHDRNTGVTELISVSNDGTVGNLGSFSASVSDDGRYVAFYSQATNLVAGDTNGKFDLFLRDRTAGTTTLISTDKNGTIGDNHNYSPVISGDGLHIGVMSSATNLVCNDVNGMDDIFIFDRE